MPSPIGHALGGIAAGALIARDGRWKTLAILAVAGAAADIDFLLPLPHRGPTHSLGAALMVLAAVWASTVHLRLALAIAAACASHTLLDWLGADSSRPRGLMALWPLSSTYYVSGLDVFNAVDRRYWTAGFWARNAVAVLRELAVLVPLSAISVSTARRVRSYRRPGAAPPPA